MVGEHVVFRKVCFVAMFDKISHQAHDHSCVGVSMFRDRYRGVIPIREGRVP